MQPHEQDRRPGLNGRAPRAAAEGLGDHGRGTCGYHLGPVQARPDTPTPPGHGRLKDPKGPEPRSTPGGSNQGRRAHNTEVRSSTWTRIARRRARTPPDPTQRQERQRWSFGAGGRRPTRIILGDGHGPRPGRPSTATQSQGKSPANGIAEPQNPTRLRPAGEGTSGETTARATHGTGPRRRRITSHGRPEHASWLRIQPEGRVNRIPDTVA